MPIYEWNCEKCSHDFETLTFSFAEKPDNRCPRCTKPAERRFSVVNIKCDGNFMRGRKDLGVAEFSKDKDVMAQFTTAAKKKGINLTGRTYQAGLARYPGDPEAFISSLDDARRICKKRGLQCRELGIMAEPRDPGDPIPVADDIVANELERMVECGEMSIKKAQSESGYLEVANRLTPRHKKNLIKSPKERKALTKAKSKK